MESETIPISSPNWNAKNPAASFKAFADYIHQMARQVFLRDGYHAEMMFFMPLDGKGHIVMVTGDQRERLAEWTKQHLAEHYCYGIVHVVEGWVRLADRPKDPILRQVLDGEMKVSELREEDRQEGVMVSAQARDGFNVTWIAIVQRDKAANKLSLAPSQAFKDSEGRFGKLFG